MFMTRENIRKCICDIKIKNTEGYDRIPQRVPVDGLEQLLDPLSDLFKLIYSEKVIPGQWLVSRIIPVHKKGNKSLIENYRPVANLCSVSKVFEKLILNRIYELEVINGINLAGKQQHGFQKNKSTLTAGLLLQSLIAGALDDDNYVALASLDLSAAFDIVDVRLLLKRLQIIGLPGDVIKLIEIWLKERYFYVSINGVDSDIKVTWFGIVQGSILGPVLYAIFISPLFDIENLTCFADDKFPLVYSRNREVVIDLMERKLLIIISWLSHSGMKVNEQKTDLCLFYKGDTTPIEINLNNKVIKSNKIINVLGVIFDSKLQWADHIAQAITKSLSALNAIRLIKKFFVQKELFQLITSNFYSLLYYNSDIWHLPSLKVTLKQKLLSASAKALRVCWKNPSYDISFEALHKMSKRATPEQMMRYKLSLCLYRLYNIPFNSKEFIRLNENHILTSRQTFFITGKSNNLKIGLNCLSNRLFLLNKTIPLNWLNESLCTFKVKCKELLKL